MAGNQIQIVPKGRWVKGQSGNPRGRPRKGRALADLIRQRLDKAAFAKKLCEYATGDGIDASTQLAAMKLVLSHLDGLPVARKEIDSEIRRLEVVHVEQRNHTDITRTASGPETSSERSEALQRPVDGTALGKDSSGD